ncbi:MAG: UDP-N-acetylmuramoyl-tripeptide--D-alanyl-D-alanine ligase [Gammaproteobacteria bacterium]|nr:UDP-N-acetylmuramoyl-tripeptide--D-alanyl-D-alanine ligase [Gammaproteobacteria bacterium]
MSLGLAEIERVLGLPVHDDIVITGVSIDTRTLAPGNLFVAFRGEQVDGHTFISEAIKCGAAAILCIDPQVNLDVPVLVYPNLEEALALIATAYRAKFSCPVVALTGSNGKTTVKEMLAAILPDNTFVTPGNWNNHLGVPLSVLQLTPLHQTAVFELGANHAGEIEHTVQIVKPDVALINNIGPAHIEGFGSLDGTAKAKGEIYQGLMSKGTAIVNADDAYAHFWDDVIQDRRVLRFSSIDLKADVYATDIQLDIQGVTFTLVTPSAQVLVTLQVPGMHHVQNALAAAAVAVALDIKIDEIAKGLAQFSGVSGRLTPKKTSVGAVILDDTYNANLNSVLTGINVLASYPGRRILVLGDMGELGEYAYAHHTSVGETAKLKGIDVLLTCGKISEAATEAFGDAAQHFDNRAALLEVLRPELDEKTTVLVKGSRSSAMEQVVQSLLG